MEWIKTIFGEGSDLNSLQMSSRAVVTFFVALAQIRIAGIRTFGKRSAFDNVIMILLGSVLSRAVVGASPYIPTVVGCFVLVLVHWVLAWLSLYNDTIGRWVKGEKGSLYADGKFNEKNMRRSRISMKDIEESLRIQTRQQSFEEVKEIIIERSGNISVIKK
ncbi:MAG TPA: YetF domain-containing protein [Puia sp.]|nr:YetF domain-containing protein [Puia sp.]